jgi:hypothetical protein
MRETDLFTLVRGALMDGFTARNVTPIKVLQKYQPTTVGIKSGMVAYTDIILSRRVGAPRREDRPIFPKPVAEFTHRETQWWETTLQITGIHRRNPENAQEMALPSAMDIATIASDILQSDRGMNLLAVRRARPLRITEIRKVPFLNDSDQWEASPSFDIVLSYPDSHETTTPAATVESDVYRV